MVSIGLILMVLALIVFMLAAFGVPSRIALLPLGLAILVLSFMLDNIPFPHIG